MQGLQTKFYHFIILSAPLSMKTVDKVYIFSQPLVDKSRPLLTINVQTIWRHHLRYWSIFNHKHFTTCRLLAPKSAAACVYVCIRSISCPRASDWTVLLEGGPVQRRAVTGWRESNVFHPWDETWGRDLGSDSQIDTLLRGQKINGWWIGQYCWEWWDSYVHNGLVAWLSHSGNSAKIRTL